jgi:ABC-2 type transport system ATP-binding protein
MPDNAVVIKHLAKSFGMRGRRRGSGELIPAVVDLSFEVRRGEMFSLVGPDGAGKSTTLRMLCGIVKPTSGTAEVLGRDVVTQLSEIKPRIGYFSQTFSLYGDLSVDENIEFFAEIHQVTDYKKRREELLQFTRLVPFRKRLAEQLSGGMKQKLALACTLVHTPELILLDEPTTGVDPVSRRDFWIILSDLLKQGTTILMTTPYLDEAERSNRVGMINRGRLMVADTPARIKELMAGTVIEIVAPEIRRARDVVRQVPDAEVQMFGDRLNVVVRDSTSDPARIRELLDQAGISVASWRVIPPSLENVFISLLKSK